MKKKIKRKVAVNYNIDTAHQRINDHEKLCRILQKETNGKITEIRLRLSRLEKFVVGFETTILTGLAFLIYKLM